MKKVHFLETNDGYKMLTSEAYDESDHNITQKVEVEVEQSLLEKLLVMPLEKVQEFIKDKIENNIK